MKQRSAVSRKDRSSDERSGYEICQSVLLARDCQRVVRDFFAHYTFHRRDAVRAVLK